MLTTAAAFSCVLVAATAVSGWLAVRAIEAERLAHSNEVRALGERDAKERARREAHQNATKARDAAAAEQSAARLRSRGWRRSRSRTSSSPRSSGT